ncbi:MAG TPA: SGNH/GDSL hydrolase family protein [Vicinamibacterales bacterium]|nr:SGNH/GDSL hydrolase family protein [Vicinamibacterales bacterium]
MRIHFVSLSVVVMLCGMIPARAAAGAPPYYLALGDSLAQGVQWSPTGDMLTNAGYADDLWAQFSTRIPGLQVEKLGCPGETTSSMIHGGVCNVYPGGGSQLDGAVGFLKTHTVAFVTLDIGGNDVDGCVSATGVDTSCVQAGLNSIAANLPSILYELRAAAGPHTPIVAMNYYDPFLALWAAPGGNGPKLALQSLEAATELNVLLDATYALFGVPMADVANAFRTYDLLTLPGEDVPVDVFVVLSWTWMTAPTPFGPDIHPNTAGYAAIAGAFARKIKP